MATDCQSFPILRETVFPPEEATPGPLSLFQQQLPGKAYDDVEFLIPDDNDTRGDTPSTLSSYDLCLPT